MTELNPKDLVFVETRSGINEPVHVKVTHKTTGLQTEGRNLSTLKAREEALTKLGYRLDARSVNALLDVIERVDTESVRDPTPHSSAWLVTAGAMDGVRSVLNTWKRNGNG